MAALVETAGIIAKLRADTQEFRHSLRESAKDVAGLQTAAMKASSGFKTLEAQVNSLTQNIHALRDKLTGAGDALVGVGKRAAIGFAGLSAAIGTTVKLATSFELQMARVAQISGATTEELQQLEKAARYAGRYTVFSATEAAQALENLALAGFSAQQAIDALQGTLNLSAAFQLDLAEATETVAAQIRTFQLDASEADRVANVLAAAISNSMATFEKLQFSLRYTGPLFNALGKSIEDNVAALGLLYNAGFRGEQAGTTLRAMLQKLVNPSKEAQAALAKYGITLEQVNPQLNDFADVIRALEPLANDLAALQDVFDMEAASGVAAILSQGADAFEELRMKITDTTRAAEMAETMNNTLWGQFKNLQSVLEEGALALGKEFAPAIYRLTVYAQEAIDKFNSLDDDTKELIARWTGGAAVGLALASAIAIIGAALKGMGAVLGVIEAPLKAVMALLSHPGLLIGATVGLLLWRAWNQDWLGIRTALVQFYDTLVEKWNELKIAWDNSDVKNVLVNAWSDLVNIWTDNKKSFIEKVGETIQLTISVAAEILKVLFKWGSKVYQSLKDWWNGYTVEEVDENGQPITKEVPGFKYKVLGAIEAVWNWLGKAYTSLKLWWNGYKMTVQSDESDIRNETNDGEKVIEVPGFKAKLMNAITVAWNWLDDTAATLAQFLQESPIIKKLEENATAFLDIDGDGYFDVYDIIAGLKILWQWAVDLKESFRRWLYEGSDNAEGEQTSGWAQLQKAVYDVWNSSVGTVIALAVTVQWFLASVAPFIAALAQKTGGRITAGGLLLTVGRLWAVGRLVWDLVPEDLQQKVEELWDKVVEAIRKYNAEKLQNPFVDKIAEWLGNIEITASPVIQLLTGALLWKLATGGAGMFRSLKQALAASGLFVLRGTSLVLTGNPLFIETTAMLAIQLIPNMVRWIFAKVGSWIGMAGIGQAISAALKSAAIKVVVPLGALLLTIGALSVLSWALWLDDQERSNLQEAIQRILDDESLSLHVKIGKIVLEIFKGTIVEPTANLLGTVGEALFGPTEEGRFLTEVPIGNTEAMSQYLQSQGLTVEQIGPTSIVRPGSKSSFAQLPPSTQNVLWEQTLEKLRNMSSEVEQSANAVSQSISQTVNTTVNGMTQVVESANYGLIDNALVLNRAANILTTQVNDASEQIQSSLNTLRADVVDTLQSTVNELSREQYPDIVVDAIIKAFPDHLRNRDALRQIAQNFMSISEVHGIILTLQDLMELMALVLSESSTVLQNAATLTNPARITGSFITTYLKHTNVQLSEELSELEKNYLATVAIFQHFKKLYGSAGIAAGAWALPGFAATHQWDRPYNNPGSDIHGLTVNEKARRYNQILLPALNKLSFGFAEGGFTGNVGITQIAGVVHGQEYVIPAWMVKKLGPLINILERMRLRGYQEGGMVGDSIIISDEGAVAVDADEELNNIIQQIVSEILKALQDALTEFGNIAKGLFENLLPESFKEMIQQIMDFWNSLWEDVDQSSTAAADAINKLATTENDLTKQTIRTTSTLRDKVQEFLTWLEANFDQVFDALRSGLQSFGTELQDSTNNFLSTLGAFVSGLQLQMREVRDEFGNIERYIELDWKQTIMNIARPGIEALGRALALLISGRSQFEELSRYGSRGDTRMRSFEEMVENFRNWNKNYEELKRLERQRATNTVAGGAVGAGIGFLIAGPLGALIGAGLGAFIGNKATPDVNKQIDELLKKLEDTFQKISEFLGTSVGDLANALQNAFSAKTYTGFVKNFAESLEDMTKQALIRAFLASEAMQPLFEELSQAITSAVFDGNLSEDEKARIREAVRAINEYSKQFFEQIRGISLFEEPKSTEDSRTGNRGTVLQNLTGPALNEFREMLAPLGRMGEMISILGSIDRNTALIAASVANTGTVQAGTTIYINEMNVTMQNYQDLEQFLYDIELRANTMTRGRGK